MRIVRLLSLTLPCALLSLPACGDGDSLPPGRVQVTQGQETDAWTSAPRVETVEITEVTRVGKDEERSDYLTLEPPKSLEEPLSFEVRGSGQIRYEVRGLDATGEPQVLGLSPWMQPDTLDGITLLTFVGRVGRFSRAPYKLANPQSEGTAAAMLGPHLLTTGAALSSSIPVDGYDFALWGSTSFGALPCPKAPCRIQTLAITAKGLAIAMGADWALKVDLAQSFPENAQEIPVPSGLESWADVAGGAVVQEPGEDGDLFIVGATRPEVATRAVVRVESDGSIGTLELAIPRMGAAASWIEGQGLVVGAGSEEAPGAELLAPSADAFTPLALPADPVTGSALGVVEGRVLRLGGKLAEAYADTVELDLACETECAPVPWGPGPLELDRVGTVSVTNEPLLAFGLDPEGFTRIQSVAPDAFTEIALRTARKGATVVPTSWGHVAVVGGVGTNGVGNSDVEVYTPACLGSCSDD